MANNEEIVAQISSAVNVNWLIMWQLSVRNIRHRTVGRPIPASFLLTSYSPLLLTRHLDMASRSRSSNPNPTISRPMPLQKRKAAPASITPVTVSATPSLSSSRALTSQLDDFYYDGAMDLKPTTKKTRSSRAGVASSILTKQNKKRERQNDGDENGVQAGVNGEKMDDRPRVRQRLRSISSIETIKAHETGRSWKSHLVRQSSTATLRGSSRSSTPLSALSESTFNKETSVPSDCALVASDGNEQTLRRVGKLGLTNSLDTSDASDDQELTISPVTSASRSRIPLPSAGSSAHAFNSPAESPSRIVSSAAKRPMTVVEAMAELDAIAHDCAWGGYDSAEEEGNEVPLSGLKTAFAISPSFLIATLKDRERYDLRCTFIKKHVDLWDLEKQSVFTVTSVLFLDTDIFRTLVL